jgi:hypothetical protein
MGRGINSMNGDSSLMTFFYSQQFSVLSPCTVPRMSFAAISDLNPCGPPRFFTLSCDNGTVTATGATNCRSPGFGCPSACNAVGPFTCSPTSMATLIWVMAVVALVGEAFRQLLGMTMWCGFGRLHPSHLFSLL